MDALSKIFDDIHLQRSEYFYIHATHEYQFEYQHVPSMVAYIILEGELQLTFDHSDEPINLQQGDLILLPAGHTHRIYHRQENILHTEQINSFFLTHTHKTLKFGDVKNQPRIKLLNIRSKLDSHMAKPLLQALPEHLHIHHITTGHVPIWLQIGLQFLALETEQQRPGQDKILDHLFSILFIECVREHIVTLQDASNWLNALTHPELSNALSAIHGQPDQSWTVESLAEQCCMSRSKFAQTFTQVVGETPLAYLQQHRLRLAGQYLRNSQFTVQKISSLVGYLSETAFSQSFKKQFGLTPSQYRQKSLEDESTSLRRKQI